MENYSRRAVFAMGAAGLAAGATAPERKFVICSFSKHFQWTDVKGCAEACAELGFEGVDLTVRDGGHVLPERVADDLPKAVETVHKAGLKTPMVTSGIVDTRSPHAEAVIRTLAKLGIKRYRWGGMHYDLSKPIPPQLAEFTARTKDLAALNRQYGVCAMYHTHSGPRQVGASFWDMYLMLKDNDTESVGVNYDIGHATVEGGLGGWRHSTNLLLPYMKGVALKDFLWKKEAKGWNAAWRPLGEGMVNFREFLPVLKQAGFSGPLQLHAEYPELGGADSGKRNPTVPKDKILAIMKRDVDVLKSLLRELGMA